MVGLYGTPSRRVGFYRTVPVTSPTTPVNIELPPGKYILSETSGFSDVWFRVTKATRGEWAKVTPYEAEVLWWFAVLIEVPRNQRIEAVSVSGSGVLNIVGVELYSPSDDVKELR